MYNRDYRNNSIYSTRVKDNEKDFVLEVPVPGFDKSSLNLSVKENYLLLDGKKDEISINKSFMLSDKIDYEKIQAEVVNGVLVVTLPKNEPTKKEIAIN